ncbi:MAG: hypothetical protein QW273_01695 [Candidatus Pacearchaeota archaeon]
MNKKINKLCKIIGRDLAELHKGDTLTALWPFVTNEAEFYIGPFFMKYLYELIKKLKEKKYSVEEIANLFSYPSKIAQYFTLFHSTLFLSSKERRRFASDLIDFINYYRRDLFVEKRSNILKKNSLINIFLI